MPFTIDIQDQAVKSLLNRLGDAGRDMTPVLKALGERMTADVKARFGTSTGPDGARWAPNSPLTLARYLGATGGNFKKKGGLSKKGEARLAGKLPLIGESRKLSLNIFYNVADNVLTLTSPEKYAATQQFGALQGAFGRDSRNHPIPWGNIPARPFMPVTPEGGLYPAEQERITAMLSAFLQQGAAP